MKSFKNLTNQLAEDYGAIYTYGSELDSLGSGSYDVHNIGNPENLKRLNQFIENFTAKSYFDPRQAVVELRAKLNTVGLDINVTQESAGEGSFPVTLFGGSFGKTPQTPHNEFETSDGIVEKLGHGLQMDVEFSETGDGMFHVDAQVVPTGLDTRESVAEKEEVEEIRIPSTSYSKDTPANRRKRAKQTADLRRSQAEIAARNKEVSNMMDKDLRTDNYKKYVG